MHHVDAERTRCLKEQRYENQEHGRGIKETPEQKEEQIDQKEKDER
jgi:hypothetical protein